jgi:hypothetical protein
VLSWTGDLAQEVVARQSWAPLQADQRVSHEVTRSGQITGSDQTHVLHVVATPVETASGVRLPVSPSGVVAPTPSDSGRGELMRAEDLVNQFPEVAICVLQAVPSETEIRTDTDREQAAYLRLFAADLFSFGFRAVITIPPLSAAVASAVVGHIAEALVSLEPVGASALAAAIATARQEVPNLSAMRPEATLEAAMDICLFVAEP